jgi:5-methylcytosine-specific restriction enzyme A
MKIATSLTDLRLPFEQLQRGDVAKTKGHGNPDWSRDEVILALNLYLECGATVPGGSDPRVVSLSNVLRGLALHPPENRVGSFRNPDGVSFKLQNIRQVASGKGLSNVSKTDREVWSVFGSKPAEVKRLAEIITALGGSAGGPNHLDLDSDEQEFFEGRLLTAHHSWRERRPKLRRLLIASRTKSGELKCEGCGWTGVSVDAQLVQSGFEAHHLAPLSATGESQTKLKDVALLCATCHRITHRWISLNASWPTREQIAEIVTSA